MNNLETGINPGETKIEHYPTNLEEIAEELSKMEGCLIGDQGKHLRDMEELLEQKKEELITESKSFQELFEALDKIGSLDKIGVSRGRIAGTKSSYDITEVKEIIGKVQEKPDDINYITRNLGLRQKVKELLANE